MTITHDNSLQADLKGPMTESEFLTVLEGIEQTAVEFADRHMSNRQSNRLSFTNEGWIVLLYQPNAVTPLLYDSIKSPKAYLSSTTSPGRLVGRHQAGDYWILK